MWVCGLGHVVSHICTCGYVGWDMLFRTYVHVGMLVGTCCFAHMCMWVCWLEHVVSHICACVLPVGILYLHVVELILPNKLTIAIFNYIMKFLKRS